MDESQSREQNESGLEKTQQEPAFERGRVDARRGFPPREGTPSYLRGYTEEYDRTINSARLKKDVLTRDQIISCDDPDYHYWRSDDGEHFIPK